MKPLIGIPCRIRTVEGGSTPFHGAHEPYLTAVEAAGGAPLLIPLSEHRDNLERLLGVCHGLLLTGGEDVDPTRYGAEPHPKLGAVSAVRDEVELHCIAWAGARGVPLLGICRGIQVINVAFGGSLYQDLKAELPGALAHDGSDGSQLVHDLRVERSSVLCESLGGATQIRVNSLHHQAVRELGRGLRAVAWAPDGVIEGIEPEEAGPFLVAVQGHPENLASAVELQWGRLFERFVEQAGKFAPAKS